MMDNATREAWVAELRSGKWRKITSALLDLQNGRCATGVLCQIAPGVQAIDGMFVYQNKSKTSTMHHGLAVALGVSEAIHIWIPIERQPEWFREVGREIIVERDGWRQTSILDLNDRLRLSFEQIADLVEVAYFPQGVEIWTGTQQSSLETGTADQTGYRPLFGQLNP